MIAELERRRGRSSSCGFAGIDWLVREVLKEAGDAVVLEPADARDAVRAAAEGDRAPSAPVAIATPMSRRDQIAMTAAELDGVPGRRSAS